jgi:hypothetical protein
MSRCHGDDRHLAVDAGGCHKDSWFTGWCSAFLCWNRFSMWMFLLLMSLQDCQSHCVLEPSWTFLDCFASFEKLPFIPEVRPKCPHSSCCSTRKCQLPREYLHSDDSSQLQTWHAHSGNTLVGRSSPEFGQERWGYHRWRWTSCFHRRLSHGCEKSIQYISQLKSMSPWT